MCIFSCQDLSISNNFFSFSPLDPVIGKPSIYILVIYEIYRNKSRHGSRCYLLSEIIHDSDLKSALDR